LTFGFHKNRKHFGGISCSGRDEYEDGCLLGCCALILANGEKLTASIVTAALMMEAVNSSETSVSI
jgi:hypothetical protein